MVTKMTVRLLVAFDKTNFAHFGGIFVVWRMAGTTWKVKGDIRLRNEIHRKIPRVYSQADWYEVTEGSHPPRGVTNDEWISCESFFRNVSDLYLPFTVCNDLLAFRSCGY